MGCDTEEEVRVRELADQLTALCNEHGMGNAEVLVRVAFDEGGWVEMGVGGVADESCAYGRGEGGVLEGEE